MDVLFPFLRPEVLVRIAPDETSLAIPQRRVVRGISHDAWLVFSLCDGTRSLDDIASALREDNAVTDAELVAFLIDAAKRGFVSLSRVPRYSPVPTVGSRDSYFPNIVSLELTTSCNIGCSYCYGSYGDGQGQHLSVERASALLPALASAGVFAVELTGGEPLAHPRFLDLYGQAFQCFGFVGLLSNGVLWKESTFALLAQHSSKAFVQISIDGSCEEVTARIRRRRGTFAKTLATIRRLVGLKIPLRVAMVVTRENIADLRASATLMREVGVTNFAVSIADGLGRGSSQVYPDGKTLTNFTSPDATLLLSEVAAVQRDFRDIVPTVDTLLAERDFSLGAEEARMAATNCGAGSRSVAVRTNGDVTGCQLMQRGIAVLGNVFEGDLTDFANGPKSAIMRTFYKDGNDPACMHCDYGGFCANCMLRIFEANSERLASGRALCGVVRRSGLDAVFDFAAPSVHNVSGVRRSSSTVQPA